MILQALNSYYERKAADPASALAPQGWEVREIPFVVVISPAGALVQLDDLRERVGTMIRARQQLVPAAVKKSANVAANLLWGTVEYALGVDARGNPARVEKQHAAFRARLVQTFGVDPADGAVGALFKFFGAWDETALAGHAAWLEAKAGNALVSFRLQGDVDLICRRPAVRAAIDGQPAAAVDGICLVSGEPAKVARLHPAVKGLRGGQPTGTNIVSFNLSAFRSYGKEQGANAPVGEAVAAAYVTALNHLLSKDSRQKLSIGDATVVFWAEKASGAAVESAFAGWFSPLKDDPDAGSERVRSLYELQQGRPLTTDDDQRFFVLGLAPNAARVSIQLWQVATIRDLGARVFQHFDDLDIVLPPTVPPYPSLFVLLRSVAAREDIKNVPPALPGDWLRAILTGGPYPHTLLQAALRRCRAERDVGPRRAALLKACLNRSLSGGQEALHVSLDPSNTNVGYRLGRLFAAFEKVQEEANPGLNATIRDRYFGSASASPVVAFPILNRLKNHHLAKLDNRGRAITFERLIGEVVSGLDAENPFPASLSLRDQGRFAVGYYHQRQKFFEKAEGDR